MVVGCFSMYLVMVVGCFSMFLVIVVGCFAVSCDGCWVFCNVFCDGCWVFCHVYCHGCLGSLASNPIYKNLLFDFAIALEAVLQCCVLRRCVTVLCF